LELVECQPLLEWLANNYKSFGATLEIITDKSQEGSQFVRGFGGIGGKMLKKKNLNQNWPVCFAGCIGGCAVLKGSGVVGCSLAGILRYKVDFQSLQADEPLDDVDLDEY
jgi:peptide chain release factor subunit 1